MATLSQANKAREVHSDFLRNIGAHSIGVDQVEIKGKKTFAVVAHLTKEKIDLPESLEIDWNNQTKNVPLVTKISDTFKPQTLL